MLANGRWDLIRRLKGCMESQQIHQLFIQFINYVWQLLHVSALHCHLQGAFLVPPERCSIEQQSIEYCGWTCCLVTWCAERTTSLDTPYVTLGTSLSSCCTSPYVTLGTSLSPPLATAVPYFYPVLSF